MIGQVGLTHSIKNMRAVNKAASNPVANTVHNNVNFTGSIINFPQANPENKINLNTRLSSAKETQMYNDIVKALSTSENEKTSPLDNKSRRMKLESLLKNGILLNNKSNNGSTTLENLYNILKNQRVDNIDNTKILGQTIDALYKPETITQVIGDVPMRAKNAILQSGLANNDVKQNPALMDIDVSGTCVSASFEYHMARKHPAEFARWAEGLTSQKQSVEQNINLKALDNNPLEALKILEMFNIKPKNMNLLEAKAKLYISPDKNARIRANIQNNFWDKGERSIIDVYMQSTLMQLGSEQTYDSLTDRNNRESSINSQGLGGNGKLFIENILENRKRLSIEYQTIDENGNLLSWDCDLPTIQKHITDTIDSGEDVVVGYIETNESAGNTKKPGYVNTPDNAPNKIINGHEITIIGYKKEPGGKMTFICNDTDDNYDDVVEYSADYLLPKIHHAGYPADIIENNFNLTSGQLAA